MKKVVLSQMRGKYGYDPIEITSSVAILMAQYFAIVWLYNNGDKVSLSIGKVAIAVFVVLFGCIWILKENLRIVVIEEDYILGHSLFGLFRQSIEISKIEQIRFGGIGRGLKIDFVVNGKVRRFVGNRRFFSALGNKIFQLSEDEE